MSSEMSPCHSGLASARPLINSEYGDLTSYWILYQEPYPPLSPFPLRRGRGKERKRGFAPLRRPKIINQSQDSNKRIEVGFAPLRRPKIINRVKIVTRERGQGVRPPNKKLKEGGLSNKQ